MKSRKGEEFHSRKACANILRVLRVLKVCDSERTGRVSLLLSELADLGAELSKRVDNKICTGSRQRRPIESRRDPDCKASRGLRREYAIHGIFNDPAIRCLQP